MLEQLFGSKTRVRILQLFVNNADRLFFVREMSRAIKTQINAVRRELNNLVKLGILEVIKGEENGTQKSKNGKKQYYKIDTEGVIFGELKALILKSRIMGERSFVDEIRKKAGKVKFLMLTGVFVDDGDAETDMLVVGTLDHAHLKKIIQHFEKEFGKTIRYTTMTEHEFRERKHLTDKFLYRLFERPRMEVFNIL